MLWPDSLAQSSFLNTCLIVQTDWTLSLFVRTDSLGLAARWPTP